VVLAVASRPARSALSSREASPATETKPSPALILLRCSIALGRGQLLGQIGVGGYELDHGRLCGSLGSLSPRVGSSAPGVVSRKVGSEETAMRDGVNQEDVVAICEPGLDFEHTLGLIVHL
jgi:hypothetical protein